ncbi:MAG: GHKL domain-containing protein [Oscillospiraceae bacterium]|nr:GHKL domain-containing protein [Oscillospiraceae bacterium]
MWTTIEAFAVIVESFLAVRFNILYFQYKDERFRWLKLIGGTLALSTWDYVWTMLISSDSVSMIGFAAILFIFSLLFLKKSVFEKFIIAVISCTLFYLINMPVLYIFSFVFNKTVSEITVMQGSERLFILFFTKMLYFAISQLFILSRNNQVYILKRNEWILISSEFLITLFIAFFLYSLNISTWNSLLVYMIIVLLLSMLDIIAFIFMRKINARNKEDTEMELIRLSLQQQSDMVDKIKLQYDNLQEMRHDYVHELVYLQGVLKEKKYSKIDEYINDKLSSEKLKGYNYIFTSNKIIDSVINYKFSIAEQKGISAVCSLTAEIPESYERDISIILSNLLDNAIEAAEQLTELKAEIKLNIFEISGYYSIVVKNSISSSVLDMNKKLQTTKADKTRHGYGLRTVRMLAEKHNGMTDIYEKDGFFIVNVLLNK